MSGYERERFVNISKEEKCELTCIVCHQIFRTPVIADCCLQAFCEICIHEWLKSDSTCPYDRKPLTVKELRPAPRLLNNLLGKLQISCDFKDKGCKEIIRLEDLSKHLDNCPFNIRICRTCFCVSKVSHNCVQELLQLNKKENEVIESINHEKEVFQKLFDEIKMKYKQENDVLVNENNTMKKIVDELTVKYEDDIDQLKVQMEQLRERLKNEQEEHIKPSGLCRTSSTLSLDTRPSFSSMLSEARKYIHQRESITESNTDEEVAKRIVEIVKNEIRLKNNMYLICQNIVYKLDHEFGSSWACIANYDKHGNNYSNSSCFVKLKFGKLNFKIYKTRFLDVALFRRRFKEGKIKRKINVFNTDMLPAKVDMVQKLTFAAVEKARSLKAIVSMLQSKLESEFGGQWQCFAHNFGDYCIHKREGTFISFDLDELKLTLFQAP